METVNELRVGMRSFMVTRSEPNNVLHGTLAGIQIEPATSRDCRPIAEVHVESWRITIDVQCCIDGYYFPESGDYLLYAYDPDEDGLFRPKRCARTARSDA